MGVFIQRAATKHYPLIDGLNHFIIFSIKEFLKMSAVIAQLWKPHSCFVQPTTPKMIHLVSSKTKDIPQIVTFEKLYFFFLHFCLEDDSKR